MSENKSEKSEMKGELAYASEMLRYRIAPVGRAQLVGARIRAAARDLGWSFNRTRDVWYADPRVSMKPREMRDIERLSGVEYGRQERSELDALVAKADALTLGNDPDFHSAFIDAARAFYRSLHRARAARLTGGRR